jgi:tetratricopeptide (TPR) repeat protein
LRKDPRLSEPRRLTELAEAVADGCPPDWASAEGCSADPGERRVIANLRAVQSIHGLMTLRTTRRADETGRITLSRGETWGGLEVREHVGRGRFGDVYRVWDPALEREVALKLIRHGDGEGAVETRVVEEGRLMARVRHPNVVMIHGAQRIEGVSGLWMEFVEGRTLAAELVERGPFTADELTGVGIELSRALEAVHRAGLVHRDVKAQNVLRDTTGRIVLGDFGTGRELDEPQEARGGLAGTPAYLAPEIFDRKPATPRSDLYSLGALLFHLATGSYPVRGRSLRELRDAHAHGDRIALAALRADLPTALTAVIERALDTDPGRRFESAEAMRHALEATTSSPPFGVRRWRMAAGAVLGLALAGLGGYAAVGRGSPGVAPPLATNGLVLVTAFENGTGEPLLDGTLEFALERELAASPFVGVASRLRVQDTLALMRRPPDTRIDLEVGREVALRDGGIQALVTGRVDRVGTLYALSAEVRHPADGRVVASVTESAAAQSAVLDAVGRLALDLRQRLGEALPAIQAGTGPQLPRLTTSSLRALQLYAQVTSMQDDGLSSFNGRQRVAERLLLEAIAEDPDFAAAHRLLAIAVHSDGISSATSRLPEALVHIERAVALSDSVAPAERIRNQGEWHVIRYLMNPNPDDPEAATHAKGVIAACEALLELDSDDADAASTCTGFSALTGAPNERFATRLAEGRPNAAGWQMAAAWLILDADPRAIARARPFIQRAARLDPTGRGAAISVFAARLFYAHEAWLENRPHDALRIADQVAADLPSLPAAARADALGELWPMYVDLGQLNRAEQLVATNDDAVERRVGETVLATYREDQGRLRATLARNYPKLEDARRLATPFIEAGLVEESRRLVALHRATASRSHLLTQYLRMLEGGLAMIEGRPDDAIQRFDEFLANRTVLPHPSREARVRRWLADAWMAKGEVTRAIDVFESAPPRLINHMSRPFGSQADWLQNQEKLATLYRRVGRISDAEEIEAELVTLLAVADNDHPIKRRLEERTGARASAR